MKTTFTFFLFILLSTSFSGKTQEYTATYSVRPYEPLTDATLVNEDDEEYVASGDFRYALIPIGFDFIHFGESFDSLQIGENGYVLFKEGDTFKSFINIFESAQMNFQDDVTLSPIRYETSGEVGERIFKLEFVKSGFSNDNEQEDYVNYQLWLYEYCHVFEFHIGEFSIDVTETDLFYNDSPAPFMGYGKNSPFSFHILSGNVLDPGLSTNPLNTLDSLPPANSVYTFRNCFVHLDENDSQTLTIYPNPVTDLMTVELSDFTVKSTLHIVNLNGQTLYREPLPLTENFTLNTEFLSEGIYLVSVESETGIYSTKFVKQ